LKFAPFYSCS
jgi:hypothetical protein